MTPTERARRADALEHDQSGAISRRWLCERVAWLEDEVALLRRAVSGDLAPTLTRAELDAAALDATRPSVLRKLRRAILRLDAEEGGR